MVDRGRGGGRWGRHCGGEGGGGRKKRIGKGRGKGDRTTRKEEDRICQLDDGEVAQVLQVDDMAGDAEEGEPNGEAVDEEEEELQDDDAVDEAGEEFLREDGVLLHELGEIVESGCCLQQGISLACTREAGRIRGSFGFGAMGREGREGGE